jgi:hypothetical protein
MGRTEKIEEQELGKMSNRALTDLIMVFLHEVVIRHGRRGGRHHRCTVVAPASPPPSPSAMPHRQVMERPPTSRRTDRWCSRTLTPIQEVVRVGRVPSTVGIVPTGLHRSMTLHH